MTNVSATLQKVATRRGLFALGEAALAAEGWEVSRVSRIGKASIREIRRGSEVRRVSIRTSQDTWIAFPPKKDGQGWVTLDDVDLVVAASVNDKFNPTEARVHLISAQEVRERFNRAYQARKAAGHSLPEGRGLWVSLYDEDSAEPVTLVGAGMGLSHPPLLVHDLTTSSLPERVDEPGSVAAFPSDQLVQGKNEQPLTIADAKRRLAVSLGVPEQSIKITIEH